MDAALGAPAQTRASWPTRATLVLGAATLAATALLLALGGPLLHEPAQVTAAAAIGLIQIALAVVVVRGAPGNAVAVLSR